MRRVTVDVLCDMHLLQQQEVQAEHELLITVERKPRLIELCGECFEALWALWSSGVAPDKIEAKPKAAKAKVSEVKAEAARITAHSQVTCPICADYTGSRKNLATHVAKRHGRTINELVKQGLLPALPRGRQARREGGRV